MTREGGGVDGALVVVGTGVFGGGGGGGGRVLSGSIGLGVLGWAWMMVDGVR